MSGSMFLSAFMTFGSRRLVLSSSLAVEAGCTQWQVWFYQLLISYICILTDQNMALVT